MRPDLADLTLRLGLAFSFLYPPINAITDPYSWLGYFPQRVVSLAHSVGISDLTLLHGFGCIEVFLALWILSGWRIAAPPLIAATMLLAIVVSDIKEFQLLFRDLSIMSIALALAYKHSVKQVRIYDIFN